MAIWAPAITPLTISHFGLVAVRVNGAPLLRPRWRSGFPVVKIRVVRPSPRQTVSAGRRTSFRANGGPGQRRQYGDGDPQFHQRECPGRSAKGNEPAAPASDER
jgi:hypothetical protein